MKEREPEEMNPMPPELAHAFDRESRAAAPVDVIAAIEKNITSELKPVRPLRPPGYFLAALGLVFVLIVTSAVYHLHAYAVDVKSWLQMAAMYPALVVCAALVALSLVRQMTPGSRHWIPPAVLPIAVGLLLIAIAVLTFRVQSEKDFIGWGQACLKTGAGWAAPSAILFWFPLRRGAMLSPRLAGGTAGMLAGLVGMSVLELHCPNTNLMHILMFHLAHVVGGAFIGYCFGVLWETLRPE
jgi:hypothetical protein